MPTTIKLRNSVTTTSAPSSLVQGEVAINITDKKVWVGNAATTPIQLLGDGGSASFTSIAFGAGTVSSPSITFTGDTNTGIYSPAADTIAFTEGGVESMRIDSSGNVGIGTSSPVAKLSVDHAIALTGAGAAKPASLAYGMYLLNGVGTVLYSAASTAFYAGDTERMRIDSSGNVGIGTSSPSNKLQVNGSLGVLDENLQFRRTGQTTWNMTNFSSNLYFNNGSDRMVLDSSGNVGIGTSSPSTKLHVAGGSILCNGAADAGSYKANITSNSGADRDMLIVGVSGVTNGFQINYINSGAALSVKFNSITTTASAANAFLDSGDANRLYRSTSSLRYKKDIESIKQSNSDAVLNLRPVWYRSKADNDNSDWSWYGLIAEEVAEVEPRLVHWSYLDSDYDVTEENGSIKKTLKEGAKLVPDGVQYERVSVLLLDVVKRQEQAIQEQQAMIEELKQEVALLKSK